MAACVGSGTVSYGAMAWRFMPEDFRMKSEYGEVTGSTLMTGRLLMKNWLLIIVRRSVKLGYQEICRIIRLRRIATNLSDASF